MSTCWFNTSCFSMVSHHSLHLEYYLQQLMLHISWLEVVVGDQVQGRVLLVYQVYHLFLLYKKCLKTSKGQKETIYRRRTRYYNGQMKKSKRTNNHLQNITPKTKDRAIRIPLKTGGELVCSWWVSSSSSTYGTRRVSAHMSVLMPLFYLHCLLFANLFSSWISMKYSSFLSYNIHFARPQVSQL